MSLTFFSLFLALNTGPSLFLRAVKKTPVFNYLVYKKSLLTWNLLFFLFGLGKRWKIDSDLDQDIWREGMHSGASHYCDMLCWVLWPKFWIENLTCWGALWLL